MDTSPESASRWSVRPNLVTREVGGQAFILMPDSTMHILENPSAVFLFAELQAATESGASTMELVAALTERFEVDPARAAEDVGRFVHDLESLKILIVAP